MRQTSKRWKGIIVYSLLMLFVVLSVMLCTTQLRGVQKIRYIQYEMSALTENTELQSEIYMIEEGYISRILPETTLRDLKNNLDEENISVYKKTGEQLQDSEFVGTGMKLQIGSKEYKLSVIGDLTGNGKIGITDLTQLKLSSLNLLPKLVDEYKKSGDINNSGSITITDVTRENLALVNLIDVKAPISFVPEATSTKNAITVIGETSDSNSGVKEYWFELDSNGWVKNTDTLNNKYEFIGLTTETKYTVRMKVVDNEGNTKITKRVEIETLNEENANVSIVTTPTEWTNENVLVAVNYNSNVAKETKQISIDKGATWQEYTGPVTVEKNTVVKARVTNSVGTVLEEQSKQITNIDKLAPNEFEVTATSTTNSITINAETSDKDETIENGCSGIREYKYILVNGIWNLEAKSSETNYTFLKLIPGKIYQIKVIAIDNAGNEREASNNESAQIQTKVEGRIQINADITGWTNDKVTITVAYPENTDDLEKLVSIDNGATWTTYLNPIEIKENTVIKAKLMDGAEQVGQEESYSVNNIDKIAPTISIDSATRTSDSITISISASDAESGIDEVYNFYIGTDASNYVLVTTQASSQYTYSGLQPATTYYIKAMVEDLVGNEGNATRVLETAPNYTLTIDANEGIYTGVTTVTQGIGTTITLDNPTRIGYTFNGWTLNGAGSISETTYTFGEGDATLTAIWDINTYTVTYDASTNGGNTYSISQIVNYDSLIDLSQTATKSGYTFLGWNTDKDATTKLDSLTMKTSDVTLYAIFSKEITLTFIDYKGTVKTTENQSLTIYNNETGSYNAPEINTYTGWTSRYWTTETGANSTENQVDENQIIEGLTESITYYARYYKPITIEFDLDGGTGTIPESIEGEVETNSYSISDMKGVSVIMPQTPKDNKTSEDGMATYSSDYWKTDSNVTGTVYAYYPNDSKIFYDSQTLYASWNILSVYIYYKGNQCTEFSGGWSSSGATFKNDYIDLSSSSSDELDIGPVICTIGKVKGSGYENFFKNVVVNCYVKTGSRDLEQAQGFGCRWKSTSTVTCRNIEENSSNSIHSNCDAKTFGNTTEFTGDIKLKLSSSLGENYFQFAVRGDNITLHVYSIQLYK